MMNGLDEITMTGWKNLKQRLSFKGLGSCCGGTSWGSRSSAPAMPFIDIEQEEEEEEEEESIMQNQARGGAGAAAAAAPGGGMNLAMALAAERNSGAPNVKTLMSLIEETDGIDWRQKNNGNDKSRGVKEQEEENDWVCCVCMERNKGAAFIPCGHTFCRVCSREMWANRGCCPICNRSILDILDIF